MRGNIKTANKIEKELEIVTFKDGTDEQIQAMLEAHYNGEINISDYWAIGDTRIVQLTNLGSSGTTSHVNQKIIITILDFDHDELVEPIGSKDKAAVTLQTREILGNKGTAEDEYYWGKSYVPVKVTDNYAANPLRKWLNNKFINAMPSVFKTLIKEVNKKNLNSHSFDEFGENVILTQDKAFLLSYPEVYGDAYGNWYMGSPLYEETQYEYYKINTNIIKDINNNGENEKGGISGYPWWLRSPSYKSLTSTGYKWCSIRWDGFNDMGDGEDKLGLAPAFCL